MSSLYFRVFIASYSYSRNEIYVISLDWVLANFAKAGKYIAYLSCDISSVSPLCSRLLEHTTS